MGYAVLSYYSDMYVNVEQSAYHKKTLIKGLLLNPLLWPTCLAKINQRPNKIFYEDSKKD